MLIMGFALMQSPHCHTVFPSQQFARSCCHAHMSIIALHLPAHAERAHPAVQIA